MSAHSTAIYEPNEILNHVRGEIKCIINTRLREAIYVADHQYREIVVDAHYSLAEWREQKERQCIVKRQFDEWWNHYSEYGLTADMPFTEF